MELVRDEKTGKLGYAEGADTGAGQARESTAAVPMVDDQGQSVMVPNSDVELARSKGYRDSSLRESGAIQHEAHLESEYGNNVTGAFLGGAARGATFGLSDALLTGLGVTSAEALRETRQRSPWASGIGEVAGAVGGSFIPGLGVAGTAGHAAEEVVTGSKIVSRLAEGGAAARALGRYAPTIARGAMEGSLYGAGAGVSNVALSDDPMSAEAILSEIGSSALLGAGVGAAAAGGMKFLGDAGKTAARYMRAKTMPTIADGVLGSAASELGGEAQAVKSTTKRLAVDDLPPGLRDLVGPEDAAVEAGEASVPRAAPVQQEIKATGARRVVPDEVVEKFKLDYHDMDTASRRQIRQMESMEKQGKPISDDLRQAAEDLEAARRATRKFLPVEAERSYDSLLKGDLGGSYAKGQGKSLQTWTGDNQAIVDALHTPGFRETLAAHQEAMDHMQSLLGNNYYPPLLPGDHPVFTSGAADVALAKNGLNAQAKEFLAHLDEHAAANPKPAPPAPRPSPAEEAVEPSMASKAIGKLASHAKHKVGAAIGGILGHAIPGVGPVLGSVIGDRLLEKPMAALTGKLLGKVAKGAQSMADGVDRMLANKAVKEGVRKTTSGILGAASFETAKSPTNTTESEGDAFAKRSDEMSRVLANPMGARKHIHDSLAGVRAVDPMLADQAEDLAFRRLLFLGDKMPKNPGMPTPVGKQQPWQPSDSEKAKWARYIETAENPTSVLTSMADGSLTSEQVETLQTLYPTMYSRIRGDLITRAADLQTSLPWKKRLTLSVLFDAPVDSIMSPESVSTLQATFVSQAPQPPANIQQSSSKPPEATAAQRMASQ